MRSKLFFGLSTLGVILMLSTSCSKVPQAEIDSANLAIQEAQAAGADQYVPEAYTSLVDSMNSVMEGIEAQKSKLIKKYGASKEYLANVGMYANEVKQQAETKKEELKIEIQNILTQVKTLLDENKVLVTEAPKGKEGTSALVAIKNEITAIETSVNEANTMFTNGEYLSTLDKVKAAQTKAASINAELKEVIAKYKMNTKGKKA
ncbi:MAG: hypothetical protein JXJ22_15715 [Bacteroidales bacterium]|nr:hypothetical protein [Bacteroidales bacterium]